ncbi:hypothetical protein Taro_000833, partial [Colocasia esculenta]|nr:hypothetical protein [Colocasia esculenta]
MLWFSPILKIYGSFTSIYMEDSLNSMPRFGVKVQAFNIVLESVYPLDHPFVCGHLSLPALHPILVGSPRGEVLWFSPILKIYGNFTSIYMEDSLNSMPRFCVRVRAFNMVSQHVYLLNRLSACGHLALPTLRPKL